ncbi:MAG: DUF4382 domain-containing protein [Terriglobia bacterium]
MKTSKSLARIRVWVGIAALAVAATLVGCGGSTTTTPPAVTGTVQTTISDPPSCANSFDHVYVTVTKVTAHISSTASETDSGWVTLVDLSSSPKQIDLLHLPGAGTCLLSQTLGSANGLPTGNYQQIRLYLLANNAGLGPSNNQCGAGAFNCVVPSGGSAQTLQLSSEAQTGIKVPPGQIAGGGIDLKDGQEADINFDFDACASILQQRNGQFRLKPTVRAGVVSPDTNVIGGTVVDASNANAPVGGAAVMLEQPDPSDATLNRVVRSTTTDNTGAFIFCPLDSTNPFNLVAAAWVVPSPGADVTYNATVVFGVPVGTALNGGNAVALVPEGTAPTLPATLAGQVTSAGASGALPSDVTLSALQPATPTGGTTQWMTIPVFGALMQPPTFTTTDTPSPATPPCPVGTDCYNYSLPVPASNPRVGTFSSGSVTYAAPAAAPVNYNLTAEAPSCTSSVPSPATVSSITVTPGTTTNVSTVVAFSGCQ